MSQKISPFEYAMLRWVWEEHQGTVDVFQASSWMGWMIAEGQPRVSAKWNDATVIVAFNLLCQLDGHGLVEMIHPKRAPKYVPAKGYWDGLWKLTKMGREVAEMSRAPSFVERVEARAIIENLLGDAAIDRDRAKTAVRDIPADSQGIAIITEDELRKLASAAGVAL